MIAHASLLVVTNSMVADEGTYVCYPLFYTPHFILPAF